MQYSSTALFNTVALAGCGNLSFTQVRFKIQFLRELGDNCIAKVRKNLEWKAFVNKLY